MIQHPLFVKNIVDLKAAWAARAAASFLSQGGIGYVLSDDKIQTRLHLYNYFAVLNAAPFRAEWSVRFISADGRSSIEKKGEFREKETVTLDMDGLAKELGPLGLCYGHIRPLDGGRTLRRSYSTVYYVEYSCGRGRALIHSLGFPVPKVYHANDTLLTSIRPGASVFMLLSNSYSRLFPPPKALARGRFRLELANHKRESRAIHVEPIAPLTCRRIDFREAWPDLDDFLEGQAALITVEGLNILYSPLVFQADGKGFITTEHFQAMEWEEA